MPRNSSGTMTAPAGQPAVPGTTISSATFNTLVGDLVAETTDSLSRSGKGGMLAVLRGQDGSAAAPSYSFISEVGSGMYKAGTGDVRLAVAGVDALKLVAGGISGPLTFPSGTTSIQVTLSGGFLLLQGNVAAADASNADVQLASTATRTAGPLVSVQNPVGTSKMLIDYQGLLRLQNTAALQPLSMVTAITPNAGLTAAGCAYWKDANGMVHLEGAITNASGGSVTNIASTTPLPAGFRGNAVLAAISTIGPVQVAVSTGGVITTAPALANGNQLFLDGLSFRATA